jgi:2-hydroxy-3-keto-5-methylthiopentenyl-1-phosphate phosphatase
MPIPSRVYDRLASNLKKFQPILTATKARDAGEADTSTVVKDILSDLFGYDKYTEITSEYAIKGTYCDLAIKLDGELRILVEVKAIGLELKDAHVKQAVDYAANQGVDWVILTNGVGWRVYRVLFDKPIGQDLVYECDLLTVATRNRDQVEALFLLSKEGHHKSALQEYHAQRQAMGRHYLAAVILSDSVVDVIRRELRRLSPDVRIDREELCAALVNDVLKREVTEGEKADEARRKVNKSQSKALKARAQNTATATDESQLGADEHDTTTAT